MRLIVEILLYLCGENGKKYGIAVMLHAINPTVGVTKQNGSLSQRDAVIINRLQIDDTHSTHAHLVGHDDKVICMTCVSPLTVKHILVECPHFNSISLSVH